MNKNVIGCLLFIGINICGAGVQQLASFTLINDVVKDEEEAQDRPLGIIATYESRTGSKLVNYNLKTCQLSVPLVYEGKDITRINVDEYNTHSVLVGYGMYEFTSDARRILSSGNKCILVKRSSEKYRDHRKKLVFSVEDLKSIKEAGKKSKGCIIQ